MYKKKKKVEKFPCDFCKGVCPLDGNKCPANVDLKEFFKTVDPERIYEAYQCYLETIGLGVLEI